MSRHTKIKSLALIFLAVCLVSVCLVMAMKPASDVSGAADNSWNRIWVSGPVSTDESPDKGPPPEAVAAMSQQNAALHMHKRMMDSFAKDNAGQQIYPDEFAGVYIDGAQLVLLLTNTDVETQRKYEQLCGAKVNEELMIKEARYSFHELSELERVVKDFRDAKLNVISFCVSQKDNVFLIRLSESDYNRYQKMNILDANLPVRVEISEPVRPAQQTHTN